MDLDYVVEHVPRLPDAALDHAFRRIMFWEYLRLTSSRMTNGLEQFNGHFLRKGALVHAQLGSVTMTERPDSRRACPVVLAETTLFALEHSESERRGLLRGPSRTAAAALSMGIDGFLQLLFRLV
jgi:hypothetical protein